MSDEDGPERMYKAGWLGVAFLIGVFAAGIVVFFMARSAFRAEAVDSGHAQYRVIDSRGNVVFEWLEKGDIVPKVQTSKDPEKK